MENSGLDKIIKKSNEEGTESREFLSYEKALEKSDYLLDKYKSQMKANLQKDVDGWYGGEENTRGGYQRSIEHYIKEEIPREILSHYYGHGVTRGGYRDHMAALLCMATNKSIKGDASPLTKKDAVYIPAYIEAEILALSPKDISMQPRIKGKHGMSEPVFNPDQSWKANIGAIAVDVHYYPLVEELRHMFPNVNIIRANELPNYLK